MSQNPLRLLPAAEGAGSGPLGVAEQRQIERDRPEAGSFAGLITGSQLVRDPETGKFVEGHQGMGGRPEGSKDSFPRNSYRAMKELIAGRILKVMKDQEGQEVQMVVTTSRSGSVTYANPLYAVKLFHDYMLKSRELALKLRDAKKKDEETGGSIRIVLPACARSSPTAFSASASSTGARASARRRRSTSPPRRRCTARWE